VSIRPAARALSLVLLATATLAAFAGVLGHDWLRLDDPGYVLENPHVNGGLTAAGLRWALAQDFLALQARSPRARCIIVVSLSTRRLCMRLALMWNCTSMPL